VEHCKDLKSGGAQRVFLNIIKNISPAGLDIAIAHPTLEEGDFAAEIPKAYRQFHYDSKNPDSGSSRTVAYALFALYIPLNAIVWMWRFIGRRPDVVYTHSLISVLHFGLLKPVFRYRLIYHEHNMADQRPDNLVWNLLFRFFLVAADDIVAISQAVADSLIAKGADAKKITVIHNGIEIANADAGTLQDNARKRFPQLQKNVVSVGMVGHFRRWKGQMLFAEAASILVSKKPDIQFFIVGGIHDEEYYRETLEFIASSNLAGNIMLCGHQANVAELLSGFSIVVVPSIPEPFGLVVLEAMDLSKPVIAFDEGGPAEIIKDGETGYLVQNRDTRRLADAIDRLANDADLREAMGRAGRRRFLADFTIEQQVEKIRHVLLND
jgi:glycosyltransferase involved in cell wall biosynthesis